MKKKAIYLIAIVSCILVPSMLFASNGFYFQDVPLNHWAFEAIADLYNRGIIKGYADKPVYRGKRKLSRYDMAVLLQRTINELEKNKKSSISLKDLKILEKLMVEFSDELTKLGVSIVDLKSQIGNMEKRLKIVEANQKRIAKELKKKVTKEELRRSSKSIRTIDIILIIATIALAAKVW